MATQRAVLAAFGAARAARPSLARRALPLAARANIRWSSSVSFPSAPPSTPPAPAPTSTPEPQSARPISSAHAENWTRAGIHPEVAARLVSAFPDAAGPTAGQRAFLLSVLRGDTDVYLKDYMGRGKTFALALAAMSLACDARQVIVFVPTPHLAQQISDLLTSFTPDGPARHVVLSEENTKWDAPIIVATPRTFNALIPPDLPRLTHIMLDEPDTMFGPLPGRNVKGYQLSKHPVNMHPPPVVTALNSLLGIKAEKGNLDFRGRRDVRTVWASATFAASLRRFVYGRGWVTSANHEGGSGGVVDLNFTESASPAHREVIDTIAKIGDVGGVAAWEPEAAPKPEHYAFVVGPTGRLAPLDVEHSTRRELQEGGSPYKSSLRGAKDDLVQLTLIEAMAFLHATSPPPPGTYALVLPPRSGSLRALTRELDKLGIAATPLVPEALDGGIPTPDPSGIPPVLIAPRAAMSGLHIPQLHTVYMLNGIDMAGLTPAQIRLGGRHERETAYSVIAGRLGRMGSGASRIIDRPQRIISLVSEGSSEEAALDDLFAGRLNSGNHMPFALADWSGEL